MHVSVVEVAALAEIPGPLRPNRAFVPAVTTALDALLTTGPDPDTDPLDGRVIFLQRE